MPNFIEAMPLAQLPSGASTMVTIAGTDVALFHVDDGVYAINDTCVHAGASLAAGRVDGKVITCRAHGFKYDLTTGFVVGSPGFGVASYPVKIVDGKILVAVT
jgi:3-phenylpropionate/trans-cinnamate dioxygenase ferredoxin subunit